MEGQMPEQPTEEAWKKRQAYMALAGIIAMAITYIFTVAAGSPASASMARLFLNPALILYLIAARFSGAWALGVSAASIASLFTLMYGFNDEWIDITRSDQFEDVYMAIIILVYATLGIVILSTAYRYLMVRRKKGEA
jgi:hypothetical protein